MTLLSPSVLRAWRTSVHSNLCSPISVVVKSSLENLPPALSRIAVLAAGGVAKPVIIYGALPMPSFASWNILWFSVKSQRAVGSMMTGLGWPSSRSPPYPPTSFHPAVQAWISSHGSANADENRVVSRSKVVSHRLRLRARKSSRRSWRKGKLRIKRGCKGDRCEWAGAEWMGRAIRPSEIVQ